jgi:hypothetical protein
MQPTVNNAYNTAVTGGYGAANNPANPYYQGYASGQNVPQWNQQALMQNANAGANAYSQAVGQGWQPMMQYAEQAGANNNLGLSQLGNTASGAYLNSNPYINAAIQSAQDPVTRNYQTAIAPTTDAMFSGGGRYGSGAMASAVSTGQQNLARGLGDISSNMMNANYARERTAQDAAAQGYGSLYNAGLGLGMQGVQNASNLMNAAGNQYWQGQTAAQNAANQYAQGGQYGTAGLNAMFNTGNQGAAGALSMYPQFAGAQYIGPQGKVAAGTGLQAIDQATLQDQMQRYYGNQKAPWDTLTNMAGLYGQPTGGSGSVTQPYFQNQMANILGGLGGAASLGNSLFGGSSGGLGGLGGSAASAAPWAFDAAGASVPLADAALAGSAAIDFGGGAAAAGGGGLLSSLFGWI